MVLGGVEKELITILKQIHNKYDITLLLLYLDDSEILKDIPKDVKIVVLGIDKKYYCGNTIEIIKKRIKNKKICEAANIIIKRCLKIQTTHLNTNIKDIPSITDYFDVAICYHIHSPMMMRFVIEKIYAAKKIGWIHNDFYGSGYPINRLKRIVTQYDKFVAVSKKVENEFVTLCPWYCGETNTAHNYMNSDEIINLSEEIVEDDDFFCEDKVKLLTVGRFSKQKGIDFAIKACGLLKKARSDFRWYLIGYGEREDDYRKMIDEYGVADYFTILGKKTNPYPYIKNCDIYVQPSRHEAYPIALIEAKVLKRPIVCTDFDGADEQIENGVNGIIVPVGDTEKLTEELSKLIVSNERREALTKKLNEWKAEDDLNEIIKHFEN